MTDPIDNTLNINSLRAVDPIGTVPVQAADVSGLTVWLTGLSSAGKSTIGQAVYEVLRARGIKTEILDGDIVRHQLNSDLGFSKTDRDENVRRVGFLAEVLTRNGAVVLVSVIAPYRSVRAEVRAKIGNFIEVYVRAPLRVCESRDLKGIYRRVRTGEICGVTGVDDPYESPLNPDVECQTDLESPSESSAKVIEAINKWRINRTTSSKGSNL